MKTALCASALAIALLAGQVCEAAVDVNVVTNGHRGSILVFPLIDVTPIDATGQVDTFIEISNDQTAGLGGTDYGVSLKCYYVNERKGRRDFTITITPGGTVSWDVLTRDGDHVVPAVFPNDGSFNPLGAFAPTSLTRGELICIPTDDTFGEAIAYNRLHGTATVTYTNLMDPPAEEAKQAFKYNAFAFRAWNNDDLAPDYTVMAGFPWPSGGSANVNLLLTGGAPNPLVAGFTYDACPVVNSTPFMPAGAQLGNLRTVKNLIAGIGCNQDLTNNFMIHTTQLNFTVENSNENFFSSPSTCVDSVYSTNLGSEPWFTAAESFLFTTLKTPNARFSIVGLGNGCAATDADAGLLTVVVSKIAINPFPVIVTDFDQTVANTMMTVGAAVPPYTAAAGFIKFQPGP